MTTISGFLGSFAAGERVFMMGSSGGVAPFTEAFMSGQLPPLELVTSFVPGIDSVSGRVPEGSSAINPFPVPGGGGFDLLPLSYGGYAGWLAGQVFDTCIVQVAPPREGRRASLGAAAEFATIAWRRARRVIAVVNSQMPNLPASAHLDLDKADLVCELDFALSTYATGAPSGAAVKIAQNIASWIGDGSTLQVGLGKVPDAIMEALVDRRGLRLHSGMLSDGVRQLVECGALEPGANHASCVHVGSAEHYRWLDGRTDFSVMGCDTTHDPGRLFALDRLVAVNAAIEVDLFGQANLEFARGRQISSVGGAADFARAAAMSANGLSIVGLPASAGAGAISRIVPRLDGPVSLARHDVEIVVTEFGSADLRGLTPAGRAERLIQVAAPEHRGQLAREWAVLQAQGGARRTL